MQLTLGVRAPTIKGAISPGMVEKKLLTPMRKPAYLLEKSTSHYISRLPEFFMVENLFEATIFLPDYYHHQKQQ